MSPPALSHAGSPQNLQVWGQFRDLQWIGGGGFGNVYRAWDTQLHREVALKLLTPRNGEEADSGNALHEARMMARVRHPNIVPVYGVASVEGIVGIWSELIEGQSLAALVKSAGPMEPRAAAAAVAEVCKAVAALHAAGTLHSDIKAENVLRETSGRVLLTDFGLSRDPGARILGGTLVYMAPEILSGQRASPASDVYALGVLLYFLVSAAFPVSGIREQFLKATAAGETRPLSELQPGLPKPFLDIVSRATAFQPETRFATAEGMLVALQAWLATNHAVPVARRERSLVVTGTAILVILAIGAAAWVLERRFNPTGSAPAASSGAYALYQQGHAALDRRDKPGNIDAAIGFLTRATAADPKFALAHADLADALWEQFRQSRNQASKDRAIAEADRAVELDSELAPVFLVEGRIHAGTGKRNLAMQDFSRALKLDSRNADVYRELAQIYEADGRSGDADAAFQKAIALDPNNWRNYNSRGIWLTGKGRVDEASAQFEKELSVSADNLWGLVNLARARMRQARLDDARRLLERSLSLSPNDVGAHNTLGFLLMQLGDYNAAAEQFKIVTKLNPASYLAWAALASAMEFGSGGIEGARPVYRKTIELAETAHHDNPSDAFVAAALGGYHAAVGDREQALTLLSQATAMAPQDADVLEAAGEGYEILGMRAKAIPFIMEALSRGYPPEIVKQSPDLKQLIKDKGFRWPTPSANKP